MKGFVKHRTPPNFGSKLIFELRVTAEKVEAEIFTLLKGLEHSNPSKGVEVVALPSAGTDSRTRPVQSRLTAWRKVSFSKGESRPIVGLNQPRRATDGFDYYLCRLSFNTSECICSASMGDFGERGYIHYFRGKRRKRRSRKMVSS